MSPPKNIYRGAGGAEAQLTTIQARLTCGFATYLLDPGMKSFCANTTNERVFAAS
jgi:hypothetical protein